MPLASLSGCASIEQDPQSCVWNARLPVRKVILMMTLRYMRLQGAQPSPHRRGSVVGGRRGASAVQAVASGKAEGDSAAWREEGLGRVGRPPARRGRRPISRTLVCLWNALVYVQAKAYIHKPILYINKHLNKQTLK